MHRAAADARGATVTGIDVAAEMVALAQRLHPAIRFVCGDAERLPLADGSFDAAGGELRDPPHRPTRACRGRAESRARAGRARRPGRAGFLRFSDEHALAGLLLGAGFGDVDVATMTFRRRITGANELWEGLLEGTVRMSAPVHGHDEPSRQRIKTTFDALAAEHATHDGALELPV